MPWEPGLNVVIIGGGFGGLNAALALRRVPVRVTLVDRRNFHLFQPLLYQVATGALSPANIAAPLRGVLARQANVRVLLGEVTDIDVAGRRVVLADGANIPYGILVVAAGASHHYFGHAEWESLAPGLKTIEDATDIRRRILRSFEDAERCDDPARARALLTFVVVGAGPTGVEMAGAISELARGTLRHDFRQINPARARILLIEGTDRVLPPFRPVLSARAEASLRRIGVEVWANARVTGVRPDGVSVHRHGKDEVIAAQTIVWAAGVQASPLAKLLGQATGANIDRSGRVGMLPDLTLPGHPEIFAIGDMSAVHQHASQAASMPDGESGTTTLPGVAPVAIQQGRYVADAIRRRLNGQTVEPFKYHDKGSMATIGRAAAVADLGWVWLSGYLAWLVWLFVHLAYLIQFQNRILVMVQWAWNYFTRNRSARLITGPSRPPESRGD